MLARRGLEAVTFWNKGRTYLLYAALPVPQLGGQAAASAVIAVGVILAFVHVAGFEGGRRAKVELARLGRPRDHLDDRRRINVPGQINLVAPPVLQEDNYTIANARVSYIGADERWEISAFADNITDEEYRVQGFDVTAPPPVGFGM